ncbi:MAG: prkC 23 [Schlesneria sp.]|nr:prkC 23 [Schlesneria sp.]
MSESPSSAELMQQWANGESTAATLLHQRYVRRLVAFAGSYLSVRIRQRVDADDIAQSAFLSFFRRAKSGDFSVEDSTDLWKLLMGIARNKVKSRVEYHQSKMRNVDAEVPLNPAAPIAELALVFSTDEAVAFADELDWVVKQLQEPEPTILQLLFEEYSPEEIIQKIGTTATSIQRTRIRVADLLKRRSLEKF